MTRFALLVCACVALAACGDRREEPNQTLDIPALY
jgi:hypothetical protein